MGRMEVSNATGDIIPNLSLLIGIISTFERLPQQDMPHLNIEIKARCTSPAAIRAYLLAQDARSVGTDHQIDTYFQVPDGRLKLREGNIENNLIFYRRSDQPGPKASHVHLSPVADGAALRSLLLAALGEKVTVDKQREIYFIDNVKFHIDLVKGLGSFVEIEAIDDDGTHTEADLLKQCEHYLQAFGIAEKDLLSNSYSDLLLAEPG